MDQFYGLSDFQAWPLWLHFVRILERVGILWAPYITWVAQGHSIWGDFQYWREYASQGLQKRQNSFTLFISRRRCSLWTPIELIKIKSLHFPKQFNLGLMKQSPVAGDISVPNWHIFGHPVYMPLSSYWSRKIVLSNEGLLSVCLMLKISQLYLYPLSEPINVFKRNVKIAFCFLWCWLFACILCRSSRNFPRTDR